ncbi:MAG: hypothetical protein AB8C13_08065 [Phycisphaerales bacterium]
MTTNSAQNESAAQAAIPSPPMVCRLGLGVIGILVALSALPWAYFAIGKFGGFAWGLFGFEILTIVCGIFAVLFAMGRFKAGWALGVTALTGSILVAMVFGLYVDFIMSKQSDYPDIYQLSRVTFFGRAGAIALMFVIASLAVFSRNKASYPFAFKSFVFALPIIVVGALMQKNIGPGAWINSTLSNSSGTGAVQAVLAITLGLIFIILVSASGHLLIRAFEAGRFETADGSDQIASD